MKEMETFKSYLKDVKNRSDKTIIAYSHDLREFFSVMGFTDGMNEITLQDVERLYIKKLVDKGNSPSSRARKISSIKAFYKWAVSNGIVANNPIENIGMPKIPKKEPKVMDVQEVKEVIESAKKDDGRESALESFRNLSILSLMFNTGIRREEVTNIKLSDLNIKDGSLIIHGKGNKERIVYFNDSTKAILSEYICSHRNNFKTAKISEYLFVSKRSEKICTAAINKIVNKYFESAGVKEKGYTAHSTRKVFATNVYRNTRDITVVQKLLGHSNPQTTMRYAMVGEDLKKQAAMTVNF